MPSFELFAKLPDNAKVLVEGLDPNAIFYGSISHKGDDGNIIAPGEFEKWKNIPLTFHFGDMNFTGVITETKENDGKIFFGITDARYSKTSTPEYTEDEIREIEESFNQIEAL